MQALFGVIYHTLGGVASGSFYMPFNNVKGWRWETFWMVGGLFSWLIVPPLLAYLTIPEFGSIIASASTQVLKITYIMGLLWGIGGLTYGLGVRFLGMSLGNSVVLGFCAAFGAIVPPVYYSFNHVEGKISIIDMINSTGGIVVLLGVLVCLIGIAIAGKAGMMKENELSDEDKKKTIAEFSLVKGLIIAIFSGILSAFFNFGIEVGKPLADVAASMPDNLFTGSSDLFQNNVTFVVILWGGLTTNFIWTTILSLKNKSYLDLVNKSTPIARNIMFSAFAGSIWFLQFFFYGMGESKIGSGASSWILHMSTIIITSNLWGIYRNEWRGTSKQTKLTITVGIAVIIASVFLVGIGNAL